MIRINIGCGQTPVKGWQNIDNSISLRLAKVPLLVGFLRKIQLLDDSQYQFIQFAQHNLIKYGDATKPLPYQDNTVDVIYSSHMIEHLDRNEIVQFLSEALRLLRPGGTIRLVIPDIKKQVEHYIQTGDADAFIESTHLCAPRPISLAQRIRLLLIGPRHHQWMYDARSLSCLLISSGFINVEEQVAGKTRLKDFGSLDLQERASESVFIEAEKPNIKQPDCNHGSANQS